MEGVTDSYTYIFSYGSNHPVQLSQRLKVTLESIMERTTSATLYGWERAFAGSSKTWNDQSVACIVENPEGCIEGIAVYLSPEEVEALNPFEHYPIMYGREKVKLTLH